MRRGHSIRTIAVAVLLLTNASFVWAQSPPATEAAGRTSGPNRFYDGESLGATVHLTGRTSIWIQETYNKIPTVPWYTTTSVGYTWSW